MSHTRTYVSIVLCVILAIPLITALQTSLTSTNEKGILIGVQYTVLGQPGAPSFQSLKADGFVMVGTIAYANFQNSEWAALANWIQIVHQARFTTFVLLFGDRKTFASAIDMAKRVAMMKADIIVIDEPISIYDVSEQQLQMALNQILAVNPYERFFIDEYVAANIEEAYEWTANYSSVRVATDNYYDQSIISLGISLAYQYGKKAASWLAFAQDNMTTLTPCYSNLDSWLAYVKGKPVDVLFYYVGAAGGWQKNWPTVANFDT